jgi:hypothetical protein
MSDEKLFTTFHAVSRGWPSVEGGVEVSIEVHSDLKDSEEEFPACRSLVFIGCLSVPDLLSLLCYSVVGTSCRSCASSCFRQGAHSFLVPEKYIACCLE